MTDDLAPAEVTYLRAAIDLARRSRNRGNHPFGALLVDAAGVIAAALRHTARDPLRAFRLLTGRK